MRALLSLFQISTQLVGAGAFFCMNISKDLHGRCFSFTITDMDASSERGFNILIAPLVISLLILVGAIVFGAWAYSSRQDYKSNVDAKISTAVALARQQEDAVKDAEFAQQEKMPLKAYIGPAAYGSVTIKYPKTWSAYVSDDQSSTPYVDGYFYPNVVPDIQSSSIAYAVRVQVVQEGYDNVLGDVQDYVREGKTTVTPYKAPNVTNVVGARIDGQLMPSKSGSMVVFPLRNTTLKLWTEAPEFQADFNNNILPNFTFSP